VLPPGAAAGGREAVNRGIGVPNCGRRLPWPGGEWQGTQREPANGSA